MKQKLKIKKKTENSAKPFVIDKHWVWEAYKAVKGNKGCAGVDKIDFKRFDKRVQDNLYRLWNRMSSGSYMPEPVLQVEIPKSNGGKRPLGIPTILANHSAFGEHLPQRLLRLPPGQVGT